MQQQPNLGPSGARVRSPYRGRNSGSRGAFLMMLEHPKIVPRSRKTLDFSRVGVAWGGSVFHHVVVVVEVLVKMYNGAQVAISGGSGGLRGAQGGPFGGGTGELREAASRQLVSMISIGLRLRCFHDFHWPQCDFHWPSRHFIPRGFQKPQVTTWSICRRNLARVQHTPRRARHGAHPRRSSDRTQY